MLKTKIFFSLFSPEDICWWRPLEPKDWKRAQRVQAHLHFSAQLELMAMAIIYFLEPLPESSVLVGGSQGLAPLLHVRSGTVYLILIESRWDPNDSSLLRQSERLIPAARPSWAEDLWMCKGEHKWFLIGKQVMTGALYYSSWISVVVWSPAKDGRSKLDFGKGKSEDENEPAPSWGLRRQYGTLSSASLHQFFL